MFLGPYPWGFQLRWLKQRLTGGFQKAGLEFNVGYVTTVRNWCDSMEQFSTLSGAYRKWSNFRHFLEHTEKGKAMTRRRSLTHSLSHGVTVPWLTYWFVVPKFNPLNDGSPRYATETPRYATTSGGQSCQQTSTSFWWRLSQ